MKPMSLAGFTIIEVMLFLAVGGMLAAALLAGTGASITEQRYRDAVVDLQSEVQQLFEDTTAVKNSRLVINEASGCDSASRGQSDCVLLGQVMRLQANKLTVYSVVGTEPTSSLSSYSNEYSLLQDFNPKIVNSAALGAKEIQMQWQTNVKDPATLLVLRSPASGVVYAFKPKTNPNNLNNIKSMINSDNHQAALFCVQVDGAPLGHEAMGVLLNASATSANDAEIVTNTLLRDKALSGVGEC